MEQDEAPEGTAQDRHGAAFGRRSDPARRSRSPHQAHRGRQVVPLLCVAALILGVLSLGVWTGRGRVVPWETTAAAGATGQPSFYGSGRLMAADPNGGYWVATSSGSVTPYGGAPSLGSPALSGIHLNKPIVGMASTPVGCGLLAGRLRRGDLQLR